MFLVWAVTMNHVDVKGLCMTGLTLPGNNAVECFPHLSAAVGLR